MAGSKISEDVLWYWHLMTKFKNTMTLAGKRMVLDTEIRRRLTETTHQPVIARFTSFIAKAEKDFS